MKNKIKDIMARVFKMDASSITDDVQQQDIEAWDSLAHLNLILELESEFDVSFEPEEIGIMTSMTAIEQQTLFHLGGKD
ncbi:MAG: acyl carrier protein [Fermentimonas sp.]|nr:acyl carrier protein [Fermentimonas sp.]